MLMVVEFSLEMGIRVLGMRVSFQMGIRTKGNENRFFLYILHSTSTYVKMGFYFIYKLYILNNDTY